MVLLDTGSSDSYIDTQLVKQLKIKLCHSKVKIADSSVNIDIKGYTYFSVSLLGQEYTQVKLLVLNSLCAPVLLCHDFLGQHSSLQVVFGGSRPPLRISSVTPTLVNPPKLFKQLIATQ